MPLLSILGDRAKPSLYQQQKDRKSLTFKHLYTLNLSNSSIKQSAINFTYKKHDLLSLYYGQGPENTQ